MNAWKRLISTENTVHVAWNFLGSLISWILEFSGFTGTNFRESELRVNFWESQNLNYKLELYSFNNSTMLTVALLHSTVKALLNWAFSWQVVSQLCCHTSFTKNWVTLYQMSRNTFGALSVGDFCYMNYQYNWIPFLLCPVTGQTEIIITGVITMSDKALYFQTMARSSEWPDCSSESFVFNVIIT